MLTTIQAGYITMKLNYVIGLGGWAFERSEVMTTIQAGYITMNSTMLLDSEAGRSSEVK